MKKVLKTICLVLVILLIAGVIGMQVMFGEQIKAAGSVQRLEEGLYAMEYAGDYGFGDFLSQGGAASEEELAGFLMGFLSHGFYQQEIRGADFGCSALTVTAPGGGILMGRNYDWEPCTAMLVHTLPEDGYESVSTACLDFLGFGEDWQPDGDMMSRMMALAAVYLPLDGINEKGLCVADLMAGDDEQTHQKTDKTDLTTTSALRLLLDRAATVDEAVELLQQYDMHSDINTAHHYALTDATGRSVTVEYIDGEMVVTETKVLTNHYLAKEKYGIGSDGSQARFDRLAALASGGPMTKEQLRDAMEAVKDDTQWTLIFDAGEKSAEFYLRSRFDRGYRIQLGQEDWFANL